MISDEDCWNLIIEYTPITAKYFTRYNIKGYELEDLISEWRIMMFFRLKNNCESHSDLKRCMNGACNLTAIDVIRHLCGKSDKKWKINLNFTDELDYLPKNETLENGIYNAQIHDEISFFCKKTTTLNALIISLLRKGYTQKEVGNIIGRSETCVCVHVNNIKQEIQDYLKKERA